MATVRIPFKVTKTRGGFVAELCVPDGRGGHVAVRQYGKGKEDAILKAAGIAAAAAENPVLAAVLPPGSATAVKAIGNLAAAVKAGHPERVLKHFAGEGAKRLVKKLKFW